MIGRGRQRVDARLCALPGVWGTAIGHRVSDGQNTGELGLTVFVSRKKSSAKLRSSSLVPKRITLDGTTYITDVVQMVRSEELQSDHVPGPAHIVADRNSRSTLTAYARRGDDFFAMSCAHSMAGPDGNPHNPQLIEVRNPRSGKWIRLGETIFAVYGCGAGLLHNFGFSDAALVRLDHPAAADVARSLKDRTPLAAQPLPRDASEAAALVGKRVIGVGGLMPETSAVVRYVYYQSTVTERYVDVAIMRDDERPFTAGGDSGLLWYLDGKAFAIHAIGKRKASATLAHVSLCMFAARIQREFNIDYLAP